MEGELHDLHEKCYRAEQIMTGRQVHVRDMIFVCIMLVVSNWSFKHVIIYTLMALTNWLWVIEEKIVPYAKRLQFI